MRNKLLTTFILLAALLFVNQVQGQAPNPLTENLLADSIKWILEQKLPNILPYLRQYVNSYHIISNFKVGEIIRPGDVIKIKLSELRGYENLLKYWNDSDSLLILYATNFNLKPFEGKTIWWKIREDINNADIFWGRFGNREIEFKMPSLDELNSLSSFPIYFVILRESKKDRGIVIDDPIAISPPLIYSPEPAITSPTPVSITTSPENIVSTSSKESVSTPTPINVLQPQITIIPQKRPGLMRLYPNKIINFSYKFEVENADDKEIILDSLVFKLHTKKWPFSKVDIIVKDLKNNKTVETFVENPQSPLLSVNLLDKDFILRNGIYEVIFVGYSRSLEDKDYKWVWGSYTRFSFEKVKAVDKNNKDLIYESIGKDNSPRLIISRPQRF